jgi:RND superfamily putative drug exporter
MNQDGPGTPLARLGRFCHDHRWLVVALWGAVLVIAGVFGGSLFDRLEADSGSPAAHESIAGNNLLAAGAKYGEQLLVLLDGVSVDDRVFRREATHAVVDAGRIPGVARIVPGFGKGSLPSLRATDHRAVLVSIDLAKSLSDEGASLAVQNVRKRFEVLERTVPGAAVQVGGELVLDEELSEQTAEDLRTGEIVSLPISLVVLIIIFRGLFPAAVPIVGTIATVAATLLALLGMSYVTSLDPNAVTVTTVLGLALSIDYSLLMVSRCREELVVTRELPEAVARTMATAGRTVVFSALTVASSLTGLLCFQSTFFRALGLAGVAVVLIALAATLTLTPAMLAWLPLGRGSHTRSRTGRHRRVSRNSDDGFFAALARRVQRRPLWFLVVITAVLGTATVPFLRVEFGSADPASLPASFEGRQVAEAIRDRFPEGSVEPITIVARASGEAFERYVRSLTGRSGVQAVREVEKESTGLWSVEVLPVGPSQGEQAQSLIPALRADSPGFDTWVTGEAAYLVDLKQEIIDRAPLALAAVAATALVLLFLMTGSVLIPLKALMMNTLSLGASFGSLVLVFQDGNFDELLGFTATGHLEIWVPVLVFVFAFGLSMDYEVFMLSRIKEQYDFGVGNDRSVELGLQRSGRIVTSAALLIIVIFGGFVAGEMPGIKSLGLAMTVAVLADATLVRCLLVPATMTLLGDLNWWAPKSLRRLHDRIGLREDAGAGQQGARRPQPHRVGPAPDLGGFPPAPRWPDALPTRMLPDRPTGPPDWPPRDGAHRQLTRVPLRYGGGHDGVMKRSC